MKSFIAVLCFAMAAPAVYSLGLSVGTGTVSLGTLSLGVPSFTAGTTAGIATTATALTAGAAGFGALGAVVIGSGAAGFVAGRAVGEAARRGRRSTGEEEFADSVALGEEIIFATLAEMDDKDCGKKYVCELAATPLNMLTPEEVAAVALFTTPAGQPGSARALFDSAVLLGANTRSHAACAKKFTTCQSDDALPKAFRNIGQSS